MRGAIYKNSLKINHRGFMDDMKKTKDGRVGQRGPAVLTLRRKPIDRQLAVPAGKADPGGAPKKASLILNTASAPA